MTDLQKLIDAVAKGNLDAMKCGQYGSVIAPHCNGTTITFLTLLSAHDGSLDAAKALHDALLPGWDWVARNDEVGGFANVMTCDFDAYSSVYVDGIEEIKGQVISGQSHPVFSLSPARAWLLAILKAYEAQQ
jgi:hypothetical protein